MFAGDVKSVSGPKTKDTVLNNIIEIQDVSVSFSGQTIYDNLSIDVRDGEFLCIVGQSGCGKSTLLRVIGDLLKVDAGAVLVDNRSAEEAWDEIAYVFQSPRLLPWRSAEQNVVLSQILRFGGKRSKQEMLEKARALLNLVGLQNDRDKMPAMLSGGERQRVSIARALAVDPRIILMDEPFSALDVLTRHRMRRGILEIWEKTRKTIVFVTHEVEEAVELADRIVVLSRGPTRVREIITITEPRPRNLESASLKAVQTELRNLIGEESGE